MKKLSIYKNGEVRKRMDPHQSVELLVHDEDWHIPEDLTSIMIRSETSEQKRVLKAQAELSAFAHDLNLDGQPWGDVASGRTHEETVLQQYTEEKEMTRISVVSLHNDVSFGGWVKRSQLRLITASDYKEE